MEVVVLIAMVVLAVLALLSVQFFVVRSNQANSSWLVAGTIADSVLSETAAAQRRNFLVDCSKPRLPSLEDPKMEYALQQSLYEGDGNLKVIVCSVYFQDRTGSHEFRCQTMLSRAR